jgi:hypothetical protein
LFRGVRLSWQTARGGTSLVDMQQWRQDRTAAKLWSLVLIIRCGVLAGGGVDRGMRLGVCSPDLLGIRMEALCAAHQAPLSHKKRRIASSAHSAALKCFHRASPHHKTACRALAHLRLAARINATFAAKIAGALGLIRRAAARQDAPLPTLACCAAPRLAARISTCEVCDGSVAQRMRACAAQRTRTLSRMRTGARASRSTIATADQRGG